MPVCGWCYAVITPEQAQRVPTGDAYFARSWVCLDEPSCWDRQDYDDRMQGVRPGRHTSFVIIGARTPDGEPVL